MNLSGLAKVLKIKIAKQLTTPAFPERERGLKGHMELTIKVGVLYLLEIHIYVKLSKGT